MDHFMKVLLSYAVGFGLSAVVALFIIGVWWYLDGRKYPELKDLYERRDEKRLTKSKKSVKNKKKAVK